LLRSREYVVEVSFLEEDSVIGVLVGMDCCFGEGEVLALTVGGSLTEYDYSKYSVNSSEIYIQSIELE